MDIRKYIESVNSIPFHASKLCEFKTSETVKIGTSVETKTLSEDKLFMITCDKIGVNPSFNLRINGTCIFDAGPIDLMKSPLFYGNIGGDFSNVSIEMKDMEVTLHFTKDPVPATQLYIMRCTIHNKVRYVGVKHDDLETVRVGYTTWLDQPMDYQWKLFNINDRPKNVTFIFPVNTSASAPLTYESDVSVNNKETPDVVQYYRYNELLCKDGIIVLKYS